MRVGAKRNPETRSQRFVRKSGPLMEGSDYQGGNLPRSAVGSEGVTSTTQRGKGNAKANSREFGLKED